MSYKETFIGIYDNYGFGSTESRSGVGSEIGMTIPLRKEIVELVKDKHVSD